MLEVHADLLRTADTCACSVTIGPSKTKHASAGLGMFAARTFPRGKDIGRYYGTTTHHDLLSREHTKKVYGDGALKVKIAQFF